MEPSEAPPQPSRRRFIDWLLGLDAMATLASALYPMLRYLGPLETEGAGGPVRLSPDQQATLQRERYVIVRTPHGPAIVLQDPADRVRALAGVCTHEACIVQYKADEAIIWCACHDGRFDLEGRVLSGPPPRPLIQYATLEADGVVSVITEPKA